MHKKYSVRLSEEARQSGVDVVKKLQGSSQQVKRAQLLRKTDVDGSAWTDSTIADALNGRVQTIENLRTRVVTEGCAWGLSGKQRQEPPTPPTRDGQGQATLMAMRLGRPPSGYGRWTLRLLANALVPLEVVDAICPETVRHTLKKRDDEAPDRILGDPSPTGRRMRGLHGGSLRHLRTSV